MLKRINSKRSVYTKDFLPHYKVLVSLATIFHWIKDCLNFPEKDSFLPLDRLHTLRWATSYLLFCIYSRERVPSVSITLCCPKWCCSCSGIFYAPLSVLASVRSDLGCLLFVGIALSTAASPFSILLSPYWQIDLPSSQCPCCMIWFEEFLMGSYKVVLCPRSGEGYFGLARRTYSLQCLPDIAAVRLNRFTFRFCG